MIPLFHIPQYKIDTSQFSNLLHDKVVRDFEEQFAEYVGAPYAVSFNSASSAIFLMFRDYAKEISIPSLIPPVVPNALINAGCTIKFIDDVNWVGHDYVLLDGMVKVIDSAQRVDRDQFADSGADFIIFSMYPTKPVGGCDGGIIVSNDKDSIDWLREASFNGMSFAENNWDRTIKSIGWKLYLNSIQAWIALQNLHRLENKKDVLSLIRGQYNSKLGLRNASDHLYRVQVKDNKAFVSKAASVGIQCGIHYEPLHKHPLYSHGEFLPLSEEDGCTMVSIPFHTELSQKDIDTVIRFVDENRES